MPDGSGMDSFADLTHTPQGDGSQLNADPVGLVVAANQLTPRKGTEIHPALPPKLVLRDLTHTPQGDTTEGPFLHRTDAAEKVLLLFIFFLHRFPTGYGGRAFLWV